MNTVLWIAAGLFWWRAAASPAPYLEDPTQIAAAHFTHQDEVRRVELDITQVRDLFASLAKQGKLKPWRSAVSKLPRSSWVKPPEHYCHVIVTLKDGTQKEVGLSYNGSVLECQGDEPRQIPENMRLKVKGRLDEWRKVWDAAAGATAVAQPSATNAPAPQGK